MALSALHNGCQFRVGDTVRVSQKVKEAEKERLQVFDGMVIAIKGKGEKMFTLRRIGNGNIGIERIFPLASPLIEKIEVLTRGSVRRAKLYYLKSKPSRVVSEVTRRYSRRRKTKANAKLKAKRR